MVAVQVTEDQTTEKQLGKEVYYGKCWVQAIVPSKGALKEVLGKPGKVSQNF